MAFVVDCSVSLAWYLEDETSAYADTVLARLEFERAFVPTLWTLEVANGLRNAVRSRRLSLRGLERAVELVLKTPVNLVHFEVTDVVTRILNLASEQELAAYDAAYLHLAIREGLPLATLDTDLRNAAARLGVELVA